MRVPEVAFPWLAMQVIWVWHNPLKASPFLISNHTSCSRSSRGNLRIPCTGLTWNAQVFLSTTVSGSCVWDCLSSTHALHWFGSLFLGPLIPHDNQPMALGQADFEASRGAKAVKDLQILRLAIPRVTGENQIIHKYQRGNAWASPPEASAF